MEAIKWQRGEFKKFYAKMKIRIGGKDNDIDKIEQDDEFEYDGSILKYAGAEVSSTQLRGAIKNGWASLTQDDDEKIETFVANRNIAKAKTINRDLSRVQRGVSTMDTDSLDEETVLEVSDRGKMEKANGRASPKILTSTDNRRGLSVNTSEIDDQNGVTIGRVRSSAKLIADVSSSPDLANSIENKGLGRPVLDRGKIVQSEGVTTRVSVSDMDRSYILSESEEEGIVVGQVRRTKGTSTEGIEIKDTSNIRSVVNEASNPRPKISVSSLKKLPPRIRVAKRIDPDFPVSWDFTGKLKERLERVKHHGPTDVFLEALYAAEGDQFRKVLEKEYPKLFAS